MSETMRDRINRLHGGNGEVIDTTMQFGAGSPYGGHLGDSGLRLGPTAARQPTDRPDLTKMVTLG